MTQVDGNQAPISNDSDAVQAFLAGGLNTSANEINLPTGDSPYIKNLLITQAGTLEKRKGTELLATKLLSSAVGHCALAYTTKTNHYLYISKNKRSIEIYELKSTQRDKVDSFDLLMTKSNVWNASIDNKKFDYCVTNEPNNRVIFTTGLNTPVQLTIVDKSVGIGAGLPITSFELYGVEFTHATPSACVCWVDGNVVSLSSISYSSSTNFATFTFSTPLAAGTYEIDLCFITWQWWAEADFLKGDQLYGSTTRFNANDSDISVAIPTKLLTGTELFDTGMIPIIAYSDSDHGSYYTFDSLFTPANASEFNFSSGIVYDSAVGDRVVPGTSFVTFGALQSPTDPTEVHFIRPFKVLYNGDLGIEGQELYVEVDGTAATQNTNSGTGSGAFGTKYYLRTVPATTSNFYTASGVVTSTSTAAKYISFDATLGVGIDSFAEVIFCNTEAYGRVGSGATETYNDPRKPRDSYLYPVFGFGEWANFASGSFPAAIAMHDSRLYLGGYRDKPSLVTISNISDSLVDDIFYNDFSVRTRQGLSVDPISFYISVPENNAVITAIVSYAGSAFVFTQDRTVRVYSTTGAVTPSSITTNIVAAEGALNSRCVAPVNSVVYFLSKNGLQRLQPVIQVGDFTIVEVSAKVDNLLKNVRNRELAGIGYSKDLHSIYLGVTDDDESDPYISSRTFFYNIDRQAWSEFTAYYGKLFASHAVTVEARQSFIITSITYSTALAETSYAILSYPYFYPIDLASEVTAPVSDTVILYSNYEQSITLDEDYQYYTTDSIYSAIRNFADIGAKINNSDIEFTTDFFKIDKNIVYINKSYLNGDTLTLFPIDERGHYPVTIYRDNVILTETDDYTIDLTLTGFTQAELTATPNSNSVIRYGFSYPSIWMSPSFIRNNLAEPKRLYHAYLLLRNINYTDRYLTSDVNTAASQEQSEIVGRWKREIALTAVRIKENENFNEVVDTSGNIVQNDLSYDTGRYDIDPAGLQSATLSKITLPLSGVSNLFKFAVICYRPAVFELIAYQVITESGTRTSKTLWS